MRMSEPCEEAAEALRNRSAERRWFGGRTRTDADGGPAGAEQAEREAVWRAWADDRLAKVLTANLYCSLADSYRAMEYIFDVPTFSWPSRMAGYAAGGAVMWLVGRGLPRKYGLEGADLRGELVRELDAFVAAGAPTSATFQHPMGATQRLNTCLSRSEFPFTACRSARPFVRQHLVTASLASCWADRQSARRGRLQSAMPPSLAVPRLAWAISTSSASSVPSLPRACSRTSSAAATSCRGGHAWWRPSASRRASRTSSGTRDALRCTNSVIPQCLRQAAVRVMLLRLWLVVKRAWTVLDIAGQARVLKFTGDSVPVSLDSI